MTLRHRALATAAATVALAVAALAIAQQATAPAPATQQTQPAASPQPPVAKPAPARAAPAAPARTPQKALDKPLWRELTREQQVALEPLAGEWDQMDGVRKKKWLEMSNKFASMKPEEQQRVHERMRDWVKLTPAQRRLARDTYTRTQKMEPGKKAATWESYQQLPEEQKKKLAETAAMRKQGGVPPAPPKPRPSAMVQRGATACPSGTVKNAMSATPPCVPAPNAPAPAQSTPTAPVPTPTPAAVAPQPSTTPPAQATPSSNVQ